MKVFLRHICLPHVLDAYSTVIEEMFPTSRTVTDAMVGDNIGSSAVTVNATNDAKTVTKLPMHSGPVYSSSGAESVLPEFFKIMANGTGTTTLTVRTGCTVRTVIVRTVRTTYHSRI